MLMFFGKFPARIRQVVTNLSQGWATSHFEGKCTPNLSVTTHNGISWWTKQNIKKNLLSSWRNSNVTLQSEISSGISHSILLYCVIHDSWHLIFFCLKIIIWIFCICLKILLWVFCFSIWLKIMWWKISICTPRKSGSKPQSPCLTKILHHNVDLH